MAPVLIVIFLVCFYCMIDVRATCSSTGRRDSECNGGAVITAGGQAWVEGAPATSVPLLHPVYVSFSPSGDSYYIADSELHKILRVYTFNQTLVTVAGSCTSGYTGDGGPATLASLKAPSCMVEIPKGYDGAGIYICDYNNDAIRYVDAADGIITTFAGGPTAMYATGYEPVNAADVMVRGPTSMMWDGADTVYYSSNTNGDLIQFSLANRTLRIMMQLCSGAPTVVFDPFTVGGMFLTRGNSGVVSREMLGSGDCVNIAGAEGSTGYTGDGSPGTTTWLNNPWGMTVRPDGTPCFTDSNNHRIRCVSMVDGTIYSVAGCGIAWSQYANGIGDNGPATLAHLANPTGLTVDPSDGSWYVADSGSRRIRRIDGSGKITTVAGNYDFEFMVPDGVWAASIQLFQPYMLRPDPIRPGDMYVLEQGFPRVRRIAANGEMSVVFGNRPEVDNGYEFNAPAEWQTLDTPYGMDVDAQGNVYIALGNGQAVMTVDAQGILHLAAGHPWLPYSFQEGEVANDTEADHSVLWYPTDVATASDGSLFIGDASANKIRRVLPNGTIWNWAGDGSYPIVENALASASGLGTFMAVLPDGFGGAYFSSLGNIFYHILSNGTLRRAATLRNSAQDMWTTDGRSLVLSLRYDHTIVEWNASSGKTTNLAGLPTQSDSNGDGLPPQNTTFNHPSSAVRDANGHLWIADLDNNLVRRVVPECASNITRISCIGLARGAHCTFVGTGFYAPLYLMLDDVPCTSVKIINSTVATSLCLLDADTVRPDSLGPIPSGFWRARVLSQLRDTIVLIPRPQVSFPSLVSVFSKIVLAWGSQLSLTLHGNQQLSQVVAVSLVAFAPVPLPTGTSISRIPCMDVNAGVGLAGSSNVSCTLALPWEPVISTPGTLQLTFRDGATVVLPLSSANVSIIRPMLNVSSPASLAAAGGDVITGTLPAVLPDAGKLSDMAPHLLSVCNGSMSLLRGWLGNKMCPSCTWISMSPLRLSCVTPAGSVALARWTVEICGMFNVTSDGEDFGGVLSSFPSNYLTYNPSSYFTSINTGQPQVVSRVIGRANISLPFSGSVSTLQAVVRVLSGAYIDRSPCGRIDTGVNGMSVSLLCVDWVVTSDGTLPASSHGVSQVSVELVLKGERVLLASMVDLVYLPSITSVTPTTANPGSNITLVGNWFDVGGTPTVHLSQNLFCAFVSHLTTTSLQCTLPAVISPFSAGYPTLSLSVTTPVGTSQDAVVVSVPVSVEINLLSQPEGSFIPSDASAVQPLMPQLIIALQGDDNRTVVGASCSLIMLSDATVATQVASDATSIATGVLSDGAGVIRLPLFGINTRFDGLHTVTIRIACRRPSGDAPPTLDLSLRVRQVRAVQCTPPAATVTSALAMRPWSLALAVDDETDNQACNGFALERLSLPVATCTIQQSGTTWLNASVFMQGASTYITTALSQPARNGSFDNFVLTATPGSVVWLTWSCTLSGLAIPPVTRFRVEVQGCPAGSQVAGAACQRCAGDEFSFGTGTNINVAPILRTCQRCPSKGTECANGEITLLPNYYLAPSQRNLPIGPSSSLFACLTSGACAVNSSTATYSCTPGYIGPLCGVCDEENNYGRFGPVCSTCWDPSASNALLAFLVLLVIAALANVALRVRKPKTHASIALKILLSHIQAVGSLRAFTAGGTAVYHNLFGWSDVVSASPFSFGALQCMWHPHFLGSYVATVFLPLLAASAVVAIFFLAVTLRSLKCRNNMPAFNTQEWLKGVTSWLRERRYISSFVFVLFLAYMVMVSSSLKALECIDAIDGVRYLRVDLREPCFQGDHVIAADIAYVVLLCVGLGFPLLICYVLMGATAEKLADPQFQSSFSFLYEGYKTTASTSVVPKKGGSKQSKGMCGSIYAAAHAQYTWWESVVLIRKAGIVFLSVLVTSSFMQTQCAALWLALFLGLQLAIQPYAKGMFNKLETVSLATSLTTAIVSGMLLQFDIQDPKYATQEVAEMTTDQWGITIVLAVVNIGALVILVGTWLHLLAKQQTNSPLGQMSARFSLKRSKSVLSDKAGPDSPVWSESPSVTVLHVPANAQLSVVPLSGDMSRKPLRAMMEPVAESPLVHTNPLSSTKAAPSGNAASHKHGPAGKADTAPVGFAPAAPRTSSVRLPK